jgi:hypothetical protein
VLGCPHNRALYNPTPRRPSSGAALREHTWKSSTAQIAADDPEPRAAATCSSYVLRNIRIFRSSAGSQQKCCNSATRSGRHPIIVHTFSLAARSVQHVLPGSSLGVATVVFCPLFQARILNLLLPPAILPPITVRSGTYVLPHNVSSDSTPARMIRENRIVW